MLIKDSTVIVNPGPYSGADQFSSKFTPKIPAWIFALQRRLCSTWWNDVERFRVPQVTVVLCMTCFSSAVLSQLYTGQNVTGKANTDNVATYISTTNHTFAERRLW